MASRLPPGERECRIFGFDKEKEKILEMLSTDGVEVIKIGISGIGGSGKTTLVRHILKSETQTPKFLPIWVAEMKQRRRRRRKGEVSLQLQAMKREKQR